MGWPWSAASSFKARVNTSLCLSLHSFRSSPALPFCPRRARERGAPSPGQHHSLPMVPKEAEANTKAAVIAILHSPPPSWKPHFNLKMPPPPFLPHSPCPTPPWTGTGQRGPPWDTSWGRSHVSTSATHRMWNMRGLVQLEPELNPAHFWDIQPLKIWGFQCNEYSQLPNREVWLLCVSLILCGLHSLL